MMTYVRRCFLPLPSFSNVIDHASDETVFSVCNLKNNGENTSGCHSYNFKSVCLAVFLLASVGDKKAMKHGET